MILESLYRAGFNIADEQLDDDTRRKIMRRVHEGAEVRLMGGYADGSGASKTDSAGAGFGSLKYWRFEVTGAASAAAPDSPAGPLSLQNP